MTRQWLTHYPPSLAFLFIFWWMSTWWGAAVGAKVAFGRKGFRISWYLALEMAVPNAFPIYLIAIGVWTVVMAL